MKTILQQKMKVERSESVNMLALIKPLMLMRVSLIEALLGDFADGLTVVRSIIQPSDALAVFPDATTVTAILTVCALAVLLSVLPPALILLAIIPGVDAVAMLAIILVVALVLTAILPGVYALSVHIVVFPLAIIFATIGPDVDASAIDLVLVPLTLIH